MGVVRTFEDDDVSLEYSLLVLMDPMVTWPHEDPHIPHYRERGDTPNGTFAGSGAGWIYADAPDLDDHLVRLELHDRRPPPADPGGFDDVLETPYRSSSGGISLAWVTCGPGDRVDIALGEAEWFRVRIARRREDAEGPQELRYHWLLQFWPEPTIESPVWLARSQAVGDARLAEDIEAILRWTPRLPLETTTFELAKRLLVSEAKVREGLVVAERADLLHIESEEPLRLRLGPRASS
jgi:hypothetical protein